MSAEKTSAQIFYCFHLIFLVVSCGMPVMHGKRNGSSYVEGSMLEITGCKHGYKLVNDTPSQVHTCQANGSWSPVETAECLYSKSASYAIMHACKL